MNKGKRIAALLIAFAMLFTGILSNAPSAEAAKKKVKIKSVSVASSLSGNKKTVYVAKGKKVKLATTVKAFLQLLTFFIVYTDEGHFERRVL